MKNLLFVFFTILSLPLFSAHKMDVIETKLDATFGTWISKEIKGELIFRKDFTCDLDIAGKKISGTWGYDDIEGYLVVVGKGKSNSYRIILTEQNGKFDGKDWLYESALIYCGLQWDNEYYSHYPQELKRDEDRDKIKCYEYYLKGTK